MTAAVVEEEEYDNLIDMSLILSPNILFSTLF
jgi:hypothetical protein